jgi:hypothetical protein
MAFKLAFRACGGLYRDNEVSLLPKSTPSSHEYVSRTVHSIENGIDCHAWRKVYSVLAAVVEENNPRTRKLRIPRSIPDAG